MGAVRRQPPACEQHGAWRRGRASSLARARSQARPRGAVALLLRERFARRRRRLKRRAVARSYGPKSRPGRTCEGSGPSGWYVNSSYDWPLRPERLAHAICSFEKKRSASASGEARARVLRALRMRAYAAHRPRHALYQRPWTQCAGERCRIPPAAPPRAARPSPLFDLNRQRFAGKTARARSAHPSRFCGAVRCILLAGSRLPMHTHDIRLARAHTTPWVDVGRARNGSSGGGRVAVGGRKPGRRESPARLDSVAGVRQRLFPARGLPD